MYVEANDARFWVMGEAARRITDARLVEVDSDHYLTLREPELVTGLIRDFLVRNEEVSDG